MTLDNGLPISHHKENKELEENDADDRKEDAKTSWIHVLFWQLLGIFLPTFDIYSDIAFMISNILQLYTVENDYKIPEGGNCTVEENANEPYCKLASSEQCKSNLIF